MKALFCTMSLVACLFQASWAQLPPPPGPITIDRLEWTQLKAQDGNRLGGRLILTGAAPAGGVSIIFEPTFKLNMPTTVVVPAGQDYVDFPVSITDNRFLGRKQVITTITAIVHGKVWEGDGPVVGDSNDD